jgi:hypothetical protein
LDTDELAQSSIFIKFSSLQKKGKKICRGVSRSFYRKSSLRVHWTIGKVGVKIHFDLQENQNQFNIEAQTEMF